MASLVALESYKLIKNIVQAKTTLISIHGFFPGNIIISPLEFYLEKVYGFKVIKYRYHPEKQNLKTSGEELCTYLSTIKQHSNINQSCSFLTHGYGALVLRESFRYIDWNQANSKIIMIAPLNQGCEYLKRIHQLPGMNHLGGIAGRELDILTGKDLLDKRLGKLPHLCRPLIIAGSFHCKNEILTYFKKSKRSQKLCDGITRVEETFLPGQYRHIIINASHNMLLYHPVTIQLITNFIQND